MVDSTTLLGNGVMVGGILVGFAVLLIVALALYIFVALALMRIAKKTGTPNAWLAWIPIGNIYLITQIADLSGLWTLSIFLGFIPVVGSIAVLATQVYFFYRIAPKLCYPEWTSFLMIIPGVNFVMYGVYAWGKSGVCKR